MAGSLNRVMLIGRCTADPEMRYLPSGLPVTQLRIATNRYGTSQEGERREFTDYHDVVVWNMGQRKRSTPVTSSSSTPGPPRVRRGPRGWRRSRAPRQEVPRPPRSRPTSRTGTSIPMTSPSSPVAVEPRQA